ELLAGRGQHVVVGVPVGRGEAEDRTGDGAGGGHAGGDLGLHGVEVGPGLVDVTPGGLGLVDGVGQLVGDVGQLGAGGGGRIGADHEPGAGQDEGEDPVVLEDRVAVVPQGGEVGVGPDLTLEGLEPHRRLVDV